MAVKTSGSLSFAGTGNILANLPVGASGAGSQSIGSSAVSLSQFRNHPSIPNSGAISFSQFYGLSNAVGTTTTSYRNTYVGYVDPEFGPGPFNYNTAVSRSWTNYYFGSQNTTYSYQRLTSTVTPTYDPEFGQLTGTQVSNLHNTTKSISRQTLKNYYSQYQGG